jgi:hypothetical protein
LNQFELNAKSQSRSTDAKMAYYARAILIGSTSRQRLMAKQKKLGKKLLHGGYSEGSPKSNAISDYQLLSGFN